MSKLITLSVLAFVCCVTLAYGNMMYSMYAPKGGMMYGGGGGYGYGMGYGINPVGQGGIMQFFFMIIFLMFFLELFDDFGNKNY